MNSKSCLSSLFKDWLARSNSSITCQFEDAASLLAHPEIRGATTTGAWLEEANSMETHKTSILTNREPVWRN